MAFSYSPKIVTDGLVLYLDAANPYSYVSGSTVWNDISRSSINGTLTNGPTFNTGSGGNIVFDGIDDYVNLSNPTQLQNMSDGTLNLWFNRVSSSATYQMMFTDGISNLEMSFLVNDLRFYIGNASTSNYTLSTLNTWFMVTGTWSVSGNYKNLYVNGTLVRTSTNSLTTLSNVRYIGSRAGVLPFSGSISSVSVYNRALNATEILQNYNATKTRFGL